MTDGDATHEKPHLLDGACDCFCANCIILATPASICICRSCNQECGSDHQ